MDSKKQNVIASNTTQKRKYRPRRKRSTVAPKISHGQRVDFFDKRVMEVIKYRLASSVEQYAVNAHDCTFLGEVMGRRVIANCERHILVSWYPKNILPDEWIPESEFSNIKLVPLRQIPPSKIRVLYPKLCSSVRQEKAKRKQKALPISSNCEIPVSSSSRKLPPEKAEKSSTLKDVGNVFDSSFIQTRRTASIYSPLKTQSDDELENENDGSFSNLPDWAAEVLAENDELLC